MSDKNTAPTTIYLQDAGDYEGAAEFEVTWCVDPQDDADTPYTRTDLADALAAALRDLLVGTGGDLKGYRDNDQVLFAPTAGKVRNANAALAAYEGSK